MPAPRPIRPGSPLSLRLPLRFSLRLPLSFGIGVLLIVSLLTTAPPAAAYEFEGSALENAMASTLDVVIIRPLASARVLLGGILFVPAALLSSPGGKEHFDMAYDLLLGEPMEYAFDRKLGDM